MEAREADQEVGPDSEARASEVGREDKVKMKRWVLVGLLMMGGCSDGDVATAPDLVVEADVAVGSSAPAGVAAAGVPGVPSVSECEEVGLKRSGVRWQVDGAHQLLLFVPMSPLVGSPYVNVWTPDVNKTLLGRGPANEWFSVTLPGFGLWRIRLAAETIDQAGRVRQCDRHRFVAVAKPPPPDEPEESEEEPGVFCHTRLTEGGMVVCVIEVDTWHENHVEDYVGECDREYPRCLG